MRAAPGGRRKAGPTSGRRQGDPMNDSLLPFQRLDIYVAAKELARTVHSAKIGDAELRDQASRAAKSTFLHICEGLPNDSGPMRKKYFIGANNSLHETLGAMD